MLFQSYLFFVFLFVFFQIWRRYPDGRIKLICLGSLIFYGAWNPLFIPLLIFSAYLDFWCAQQIRLNSINSRLFVTLSLLGNLGLLCFFKYGDFLLEMGFHFGNAISLPLPRIYLDVILPVGISFYTFQTIAYTIDVYRNEIAPEEKFVDYFAYVSFFPQLVAGPIERPQRLLPQIKRSPETAISKADLKAGVELICRGLIKKLVIADVVAGYVDTVYADFAGHSAYSIFAATLLFAIQIYCDFSGYTDIARGVARIFGIRLMENFDYPYFSCSMREFWHRWHISLSTWLRDYLYISLGGNRRGAVIWYRNLFVTMVLGGLWHGASANFVAWGAYHGVLLIVEQFVRRLGPKRNLVPRSVRWIITINLILFGWLLFRIEDIGDLWAWFSQYDLDKPRHEIPDLRVLGASTLFVFVTIYEGLVRSERVRLLSGSRFGVSVKVLAVLASFAVFSVPSDRPFIYFAF